MKLASAFVLGVFAPLVIASRPSATVEPQTLVVATLDTSRADAFIGNLFFSGAQLVYAAGSGSASAARRVGVALGTRVVVDSALGATQEQSAALVADRVQNVEARVVVVLLEPSLSLPFLRHVTGRARASFPLSGTAGRMWVITRSNGYTSAIRGSF